MTNPFHPFKPPFKFIAEHIVDADGEIVAEVMKPTAFEDGKLYLRDPRPDQRDSVGTLICKLMNEHAIKEGQ